MLTIHRFTFLFIWMNYTQAFDLECMSISRAHTVKRTQNLFTVGYIYLITPDNGWRYWEKITSFYTLHCNRRFSIKCMKKCIFYTLLKTNKIEIMKSNQFINNTVCQCMFWYAYPAPSKDGWLVFQQILSEHS